MTQLLNKEELFLKSINKFFSDPLNFNLLLEILHSKYAKSVIEWFVCNYTKKRKNYRYIYIDYKHQLENYTKKFFDPFKRQAKKEIKLNGVLVKTTLGQLNFFKWFIGKKHVHLILNSDFYKAVKLDMKQSIEKGSKPKS